MLLCCGGEVVFLLPTKNKNKCQHGGERGYGKSGRDRVIQSPRNLRQTIEHTATHRQQGEV